MSMPVLRVAHPDAHSWDAFVDQHDEGHPLQSSRWGQLKSMTGWECQRIAVYEEGELMAGAQVLIKRRFGLAACYVPRGPLLCGDRLVNQAVVAAVNGYASTQRAVFVRYEPNSLVDSTNALLYTQALATSQAQVGTTLQPQHSVHTPLASDSDIRKQCSKGHRADIKKAEKSLVQIRIAHHDHDIDTFADLMQATGARAGFAVHSADYYRQVWQLFGSIDRVALFIAEQDDTPIAAAMVVRGAEQACYLYGGSQATAFACGANHLLQAHAMEWAQSHGCQIYDAWGIPYRTDQDTPPPADDTSMQGLIRFKKGFGGYEVSYLPAYTHVLMPLAYRLLQSRLSL